MTPESLQLYKLIILYFLHRTGQPMPNAILSDFILDHGYTDYLSIQQTLSELTEDQMILVEQTHKKSYYTITPSGEETLRLFGSKMPTDTGRQIDQYLTDKRFAILEETSIKTDYTQVRPHEYLATGCIYERGSKLLEISLSVPTEEEAVEVCNRFQDKSDTIYAELLARLCGD